MDIESLKPSERLRVIDLVSEAGIDVSDWANFKGGIEKAASNPKYCYEWSYEDYDKKLIVLNLWYENIEVSDGAIVQKLNLRKTSEDASSSPQSRRALKMDFSLQKAARLNWPVRVIICDGPPRNVNATKSSADRRLLDGESWYIQSYDSRTGDCVLVRGKVREQYVDQFDIKVLPKGSASKKESTTTVYDRSSRVRSYVLSRSKGNCEWCGEAGFITPLGSLYLETHHIQPLSENGSDTVDNVISLCPNHHREAHFGVGKNDLKQAMSERVKMLNKALQPTQKARG